ncbi:hypothetical protein [Dechloromonas hortensis]|uniref:hypothetical protein n=1 Tax=Dechloromonas hortensis TaxID=337779 RepID=UPI001290C50C|nr:hypothetical protein [Dechloromonas hortensis]
MSRLAEIIRKLYHLPQSHRQALALSRAHAERVPVLPGVAMISITAPERSPAQLDGYEHLLRLSFADVDFAEKGISDRAKAKLPAAMSVGQAQQILDFVSTLPADVHTLLVHCEGGFSRSCGVVVALREIYGYAVEPERLTKANPSVTALLHQVAGTCRRGKATRGKVR